MGDFFAMPKPRMEVPPSAPNHLRAWRQRAGLSLVEVAEREGVSHSAVQRWEMGIAPVTLQRLETLARTLGVQHTFQLLLPPDEIDAPGQLWRHWLLLRRMNAAEAAAWLAFGERIAPPEIPPDPAPDVA